MGLARLLALVVAILLMIGLLWILIAGSTISYGETYNFKLAQGGTTPENCKYAFPYNTEITLTATPCPDSVFVKWTGDFCNGSKLPTCTFKMPGKDATINAEFRKKPMKPTWRRDGKI